MGEKTLLHFPSEPHIWKSPKDQVRNFIEHEVVNEGTGEFFLVLPPHKTNEDLHDISDTLTDGLRRQYTDQIQIQHTYLPETGISAHDLGAQLLRKSRRQLFKRRDIRPTHSDPLGLHGLEACLRNDPNFAMLSLRKVMDNAGKNLKDAPVDSDYHLQHLVSTEVRLLAMASIPITPVAIISVPQNIETYLAGEDREASERHEQLLSLLTVGLNSHFYPYELPSHSNSLYLYPRLNRLPMLLFFVMTRETYDTLTHPYPPLPLNAVRQVILDD